MIRHTQDTIPASCLNDMSKYNNLNEIKKTRLAYDSITVQLSKKSTCFQYKLMKKGGWASEFENAIEWPTIGSPRVELRLIYEQREYHRGHYHHSAD